MIDISMEEYQRVFGKPYTKKYICPARVNLIGEHIDYNGGKVLPAAISLYIYAYVRKNDNKEIRLYSGGFSNDIEIYDLDHISYKPEQGWTNYPLGMFHTLMGKGYKIDKGLDIYFISNIPPASGLSSSAAMLDLVGYILSKEFNLNLSMKEIALLAQYAENNFNGLACGIMDQAAIALGKKDHAVLIDTSNFSYEYKPIKLKDYTFVVLSTNKHRLLTESKYNERVDECNKALNILKKHYNINNLCELRSTELDNINKLLNDDLLFRRVRHLITENERVQAFIKYLAIGDEANLGRILNESDNSLREDYEVTGLHLDTITRISRSHPACLGARMTGAGFGGCGIALVKKNVIADFIKFVTDGYLETTGIKPDILNVDITSGVGEANE